MNKINWYSLFAHACIIFIFVYFLGFLMGYFSTFLGFSIFKQVALMKILLIFFYFLFSLILTISHKVTRLHLFLLVVVADLLSNHLGIGKPNYFPKIFIFNIILYFIIMYLGNYVGKKYLSKRIK